MIEPNQGEIPGYTGHQKCVEEVDTSNKNKVELVRDKIRFQLRINDRLNMLFRISEGPLVWRLTGAAFGLWRQGFTSSKSCKQVRAIFKKLHQRMYTVKPTEIQATLHQLSHSAEVSTCQHLKYKQQDLVNVEKTRFATKYIISSNKDNESYTGRSAFLQETRDNISNQSTDPHHLTAPGWFHKSGQKPDNSR